MDFTPIIEELQQQGLAGRRYEQEGHSRYRDCLTVCRSGRLLLERYCYGEAAGLVARLWAEQPEAGGSIAWEASHFDDLPKALTAIEGKALRLDEKKRLWQPQEDLRRIKGEKSGLLGFFQNLAKR